MRRPKTIFCDIDGTLVEHTPPSKVLEDRGEMKPLPGTKEVLSDWDRRGYNVVLTTGRKESLRRITESQLDSAGIFYDRLLMGIGGGDRVIINDNKEDGRQSCWAMNPERNQGLKGYSFLNLAAIAEKYFESISKKNFEIVEKILDNDVVLVDWDGKHVGVSAVMKFTRIMLDALPKFNVEVVSLARSGNKVFSQIIIHTEEGATPVIDVLEFSDKGKIQSITAYRGN